jgi:beta-lactamase regulating signal transducer with metallopeptidase domain
MIDFLIKSSISLAVFLSFYNLVLEREKMHQFNRFYLLFSIVISFAIPFLTFEIIKIVPIVQNIEPLNTISITSSQIPENEIENFIQKEESINLTPYILWSLYGMISFLLLLRFGKNIWKLILKSRSNPSVKYKNANLVLVEEKILPHTFLNSIFINFDDYNNRNIEDELYSHELVHVTQKHTLDILFIEFLKVVFWFNPLFILYKKAIQLNHEFLADEEIVKTYNNVPFYQNLLLNKSNNNQTIYLASNLNYLVTKKRLIMMTKITSKKIAILKKVAIIPILAGLIYFFCIEVVAQEKTISVNQDGVSEVAINELEPDNSAISDKRRDAYYKGVYVKIKDVRKDTTIKIKKMYEDLTLKEKRHFLSWVPNKINPKKVNEELFNKLSNTNKEAVWIDGKAVKNSDLKKYKSSDFKYYTHRFIEKRVRLKQFPQEYQYTLYTNDYFDKNLKNSHLKFGRDTLKMAMIEYQEAVKRHPNKFSSNSQEKNSAVTEASYFKGVRFIFRDGGKNGKVIIDKLYEELTTEDKRKFGKFAFYIPKPYQKISPTQKEMEEFKNGKKYAIWIDGKHVPNENLCKYKPNEIAHFSGSVILKNARSKKFPQPFQYWFSTHKYFEETKMGVQQTKYGGDKVVNWFEKKSKSNKKEND